jgi:hypothetical protein
MPEQDRAPVVKSSDTADGLQRVRYWLYATRDDFDLERFLAATPALNSEQPDLFLFFSPRDGKNGKYHVRLEWEVRARRIELRIEYINRPMRREADEKEPYAEDFMRWLGGFFKTDTAPCHMHVHFRYGAGERDSTFPLQLRAAAPSEAILTGVSLRLPNAPEGIQAVRLTRGTSRWYGEMIGEGSIRFDDYSLNANVSAAGAVLSHFLKEIRS